PPRPSLQQTQTGQALLQTPTRPIDPAQNIRPTSQPDGVVNPEPNEVQYIGAATESETTTLQPEPVLASDETQQAILSALQSLTATVQTLNQRTDYLMQQHETKAESQVESRSDVAMEHY